MIILSNFKSSILFKLFKNNDKKEDPRQNISGTIYM